MKIKHRPLGLFLIAIALTCCTGLVCRLTPGPLPSPLRALKPGLPGIPPLPAIGNSTSLTVLLAKGYAYPCGYTKFVERCPKQADPIRLMLPVDTAYTNNTVEEATDIILLFPVCGDGVYARTAGIRFWIPDPDPMFSAQLP